MSPGCFQEWYTNNIKFMLKYPDNQHINMQLFPATIRIFHSPNEETFLDGTMTLNFKRDFLGLPMLFIAYFLPSNPQTLHFQCKEL
jgi:hypothetical protein